MFGCTAEQKQAVQSVEQNRGKNGSAGTDRHRYGSSSINEDTSNDLAEGLRSSANLGAVGSQAAGALKSGGAESTQPSDQQHPILATAVNQTAKAEKAVSKSGSVQPDEARAGSRSIEITRMC